MGIGSLQKALAMQCGGILHLTQDELTIIVFPIKVFSKKRCDIFFSFKNMFLNHWYLSADHIPWSGTHGEGCEDLN